MKPLPENLALAFSAAAQEHFLRPALVDGERRLSFGEELKACQSLAAFLIAATGPKSGHIGLLLPNGAEAAVIFFGTWLAGKTAVPLNPLSPPSEIVHILAETQTSCLFTLNALAPLLEGIRPRLPRLKYVIYVDRHGQDPDWVKIVSSEPPPRLAFPPRKINPAKELAAILYTSGSTGRPKGVMLTHANFLHNVRLVARMIDIYPQDSFLCLLPLFHALALTSNLILAALCGCKLVFLSKFHPKTTLDLMHREKLSCLIGVPPIFAVLSQIPLADAARGEEAWDLSAFRLAVSGGAPLADEVALAFERRFGVTLIQGYGLTETAPVVSLTPGPGRAKLGSVGLPLAGVEVKIVGDNGKSLGVKQVGEIYVRGANVMEGYYQQPVLTRECLNREGWLSTGDLGKVDGEGYLYIVGRKKETIISSGENIYPQEVEMVLSAYPGIQDVAVVPCFDPLRGEVPCAFVVMNPLTGPYEPKSKEKELREFLRLKLAPYKIPKHFIFKPELPKAATGKILKHLLPRERLTG
jgi:long-chain acyl-CoA synthetase